MLIVLKKKVDSNQWGYPTEPSEYTRQFLNPENANELVAFNNSGKPLEELTALAGYSIIEYTGAVVGTGIRIISLRAFYERLPATTRKALRESVDDEVLDVVAGMELSAYVDLDSYVALRDIGLLTTKGLLTQEQADALTVDGQSYEKYSGGL